MKIETLDHLHSHISVSDEAAGEWCEAITLAWPVISARIRELEMKVMARHAAVVVDHTEVADPPDFFGPGGKPKGVEKRRREVEVA